MKNKVVVFLHQEKTGGTTFGKVILEKNLKTIRYPRGVIPDGGWKSYNAIHGHFNQDIVENSGQFAGRELIYFTFLRYPITRLMSYYYFAHHEDDIEFWLREHKQSLSNVMVKRLSNCTRQPTINDLEKAKETLDNINFGITELFDESLRLFQFKYPDIFRDITYEKKNVTKNKYNYDMHNESVKVMLHSYNHLDLQLYKYALNLFKERLNETKI